MDEMQLIDLKYEIEELIEQSEKCQNKKNTKAYRQLEGIRLTIKIINETIGRGFFLNQRLNGNYHTWQEIKNLLDIGTKSNNGGRK